MKFAHTIKQKTKIAILLFGVMACTILIRILEDKSIKNMNASFISLYNDRLIPATDLFYLSENMYAKRYILGTLVEQPKPNTTQLIFRLKEHNNNINALLKKYEKTYLTTQEKQSLNELKTKLSHHQIIEDEIIAKNTISSSTGKTLFETLGLNSFNAISHELVTLTQIQSKVGKELVKNSKYLVSGSELYSSIQFGLAIIIGVLIVAIIFASNVAKSVSQRFNLN
jgi:hypothetical protein